jgi:hypothetical protein
MSRRKWPSGQLLWSGEARHNLQKISTKRPVGQSSGKNRRDHGGPPGSDGIRRSFRADASAAPAFLLDALGASLAE